MLRDRTAYFKSQLKAYLEPGINWYIYCIYSATACACYVGISQDPFARIKNHNRGTTEGSFGS